MKGDEKVLVIVLMCMILGWGYAGKVGCPPRCQTCDGDEICSKCNTNSTLQTQTNTCPCISQHFPINNTCFLCEDIFFKCHQCSTDSIQTNCTACETNYFQDDNQKCKICGDWIDGCKTCESTAKCSECVAERQLANQNKECKSKSVSMIVIIAAIVGAVVLIGAGFAVFKCMQKKKLQNASEYEKI